MLLQNADDLLIGKPGSFHRLSPSSGCRLTSKRGQFRGAGQPVPSSGSLGGNSSFPGTLGGNSLPGSIGDIPPSFIPWEIRQYTGVIAGVTIALFMLCPTLMGALLIIFITFSASEDKLWPSKLRELGPALLFSGRESEEEAPSWLMMMEGHFNRLLQERSALVRTFRALFGLALIAVGVSAVALNFALESGLNASPSNIWQSTTFLSPMIIFQVLAGFLLRQAFTVQKEIGSVREEINALQIRASAGLMASGSDEALEKFLDVFPSKKAEESGESDIGEGRIEKPIDVRTLAALLSALFRQPV
jgi:hypothetical protein